MGRQKDAGKSATNEGMQIWADKKSRNSLPKIWKMHIGADKKSQNSLPKLLVL